METKNFIFEEYYLHLVNFKKTAKFKYFAKYKYVYSEGS